MTAAINSIPLDQIQRTVIENMSTSVMVLDEALRVMYINPACEMLFDISRRKARGKAWKKIVIADQIVTDRLHETLETGHPFTEREVQLELMNGRNMIVDYSITPLYEPGIRQGLLVEFQYMERQLRISKEESLISQNQAARALVRGFAHEVKNPLGGLRGAAQLLESELDTDELKEYTQIIIAEADRLQNLMNRMLGPTAMPNKNWLNLHEVLEHVHTLVSVDKSRDVQIVRDYDPSIPEINADRDQLIQAILNLVQNAMQAMGNTGTVTLRTRSQRQFTIGQHLYKLVAMIEIVDDGPGIPQEMQDRIFLPMISSRADGSGLGLSIAQSMINRHNGLIEFKSKPGETVFRILLPLETEHEHE